MPCIIARGSLWHRCGLSIAAAFSVVLLIPLVHSYSYQGTIGCIRKISASPTHGERFIAIGNVCGNIRITFSDSPDGPFTFLPPFKRRGSLAWWTRPGGLPWSSLRQTFWFIGYDRQTVAGTSVYFPAWMLIVLCGIAPSLWLRRLLRKRSERAQRGFAVEPSNMEA